MRKVSVFGAGGHAKVVIDILQKSKEYEICNLFAKNPGFTEFLGFPVYDQDHLENFEIDFAIVAIGDNWIRSKVVNMILQTKPKLNFISAIYPSAIIANDVVIGAGSTVMPGCVIGPGVRIGNHCIVNTSCSIDHDCRLDDYSSIAPGSTLGGGVKVGKFSAISLGAKIIHGMSIGEHSVIGAGSTLVKSIESFKVAFGSPCKIIRSREQGESYI
ncbi:MAG: acetyltransferase [Bdellovibrionaceae bacterium]|nr:acetyltransferase [Pseudobdellovibrionaceae bacterium]